jgi:hypothetical protein
MAKVLIKVDVRRKSAMLEILRTQKARRQALGENSFSYAVNDDARHVAYIILEWKSFESARSFVDSPASKDMISEWPLEEVFEVLVLRDMANDYGEEK